MEDRTTLRAPEEEIMAAIDDLTELVERAAAAEKTALSSKWKEESDVQGLIRRMRKEPRSNGKR